MKVEPSPKTSGIVQPEELTSSSRSLQGPPGQPWGTVRRRRTRTESAVGASSPSATVKSTRS